jgi:hypothetical protein
MDGKIRLSTDNGNDWTISLEPGTDILRSVVAGDDIIAGGWGVGPFRIDNTNTWSLANGGLRNLIIYGFAYNKKSKTVFAGSIDQDGIYRSTDFGDSWTVSNSGFDIPVFGEYKDPSINSIFIDSTSDDIYFTTGWWWGNYAGHTDGSEGGAGVWKSSDEGLIWRHIGLDSLYLNSVAVQNGTVYAASYGGSGLFYLSGDSTWTHVSSPNAGTLNSQGKIWFLYPTKYGLLVGFANWGLGVYLMQGTPSHPQWLYLGLEGKAPQSVAMDAAGYLYVGEQMGVYKSTMPLKNIVSVTDQLKITSQIPASLDTVHINVPCKFQVTASDPNGDALTYTWKINGVIDSSIASNSLTYTFKKLASTTTVSVVVTNYLGSSDSTQWKFVITSVLDAPGLPKEFALSQNYPNPFNPTTSISYSIPKSAFVTIKVYDLLGREVTTLVNENKPVGNYNVEFNAGKLVSGVYFYRMKAGDFVQTKKLILLK